jgi:hypothetical protein
LPVDPTPYALGQKTFPGACVWRELKPDYLVITSPLDLDGVTVEGLLFRATARKSLPDEQVSFQLEYRSPTNEGGPFARLEWRPLRPHDNNGYGPPEFRYRKIVVSHRHSFSDNWAWCPRQVERGKLKVALPLEPEPQTFAEFLAIAAVEFRIAELATLSAPEWEANLL